MNRFGSIFANLCIAAVSVAMQSCFRENEIIVEPEPEQVVADSYHDKLRTRPYPKSDNDIYINPTPLIVPQSLRSGVKLQFNLSDTPDFTSPRTTVSEARTWLFHNPHRTLENGRWYWRFRNIAADGSVGPWSQTYDFEVDDSAIRFLTPPFDTFLDNAPHGYPRLYCFADADIDSVRRNIVSHTEYKNLCGRASNALDSDLNQFANPYDHIDTIADHIEYLYQACYLTGEEKYFVRLKEYLELLLSVTPTDRVLFATNFGCTDIVNCHLSAYDMLYERLDAATRNKVETLLMRALRRNDNSKDGSEENNLFDNHFWQHNLRCRFQTALLLYDNPEYEREVLPVLEYYYELWTARAPASGFNRDGNWHNGTGYFTANVETLVYMPLMLSHVTGTDFLAHPWYANAGRALLYSWPPDSRSVGFGDNSEKWDTAPRIYAAFADFLARETGDACAGSYASQCADLIRSDYALRIYRMTSAGTYSTTLPDNLPKYVWYQDTGEVAMHSAPNDTSNDLALAFRSSTFGSGSHTTACQNAFNLLYRGADVYRSSGYYTSFNDAHNLLSYRHTRAHNTILVNGIGQPYSTRGYGNVARAMGGDHITYCLGDASHAYSGVSDDSMWIEAFSNAGLEQTPEYGFGQTPLTLYRRHVLMLHPDVVVIYDELEASEPVGWDWLLHSFVEFAIDQSAASVTTVNTQKEFHSCVQLFCNDRMSLSQTDRFFEPPVSSDNTTHSNQWHLTAAINGVRRTRILAIIQVQPIGKAINVLRNANGIIVCGAWNIKAELDSAKPASLTIRSLSNDAAFSLGNDNPVMGGKSRRRAVAGSSILYDSIDGNYTITEQTDAAPNSTRTVTL